jgi:uncharacterized integral membrane protein
MSEENTQKKSIFRVKLTRGDYDIFSKLVHKKVYGKVLLKLIILVIIFISIYPNTNKLVLKFLGENSPIVAFWSVIYFAALFVTVVIGLNTRKRRGISEEGETLREHEYIVDEKGIMRRSTVNSSFVKWKAVLNIDQSVDYIFIYIDNSIAYIIPKNSIGTKEEARDFLGKIISHWQSTLTPEQQKRRVNSLTAE